MNSQLADLVNETDRRILQTMVDGQVHTATGLSTRLDADRSYLNVRLTTLESLGFIERVKRGVYRIDTHGRELAQEAHR